MPKGILFWLIYVLCFVLGMLFSWPASGSPTAEWRRPGVILAIFILLFLLGWGVFGFVVQ